MSTSYKFKRFLTRRYQILALVLLVVSAGLLLLPKYEKHEGIKPELLLSNSISPERYISTDNLANKIINQDPSFLLVDTRSEEEFKKYTLPNAIHIPLNKLLDEESTTYLNQNQYDVVLFSNDNFYADQAWVICNRLGYKNLYVLKGGLNNWYNTIINPSEPSEDMQATAFELYSTRKAASMYFGVAYPEQVREPVVKKVIPKKVITVKKKKKMPVEGGC